MYGSWLFMSMMMYLSVDVTEKWENIIETQGVPILFSWAACKTDFSFNFESL